MQFFKRKLLYPPKSKKGESHPFDSIYKSYRRHLESLQPKLSERAWKLACLSFHDARVSSVVRPNKQTLTITLDQPGYDVVRGGWLAARSTTLEFSGVKKEWVPQTIVGDVWLYEEINLSDLAAFDYQVLLWKDEIRIQADDIHISMGS